MSGRRNGNRMRDGRHSETSVVARCARGSCPERERSLRSRAGLRFTSIVMSVLAFAHATAALPPPRPESRHGEFQFRAQFDNAGVDGKPAHVFTAYLWIPPSSR